MFYANFGVVYEKFLLILLVYISLASCSLQLQTDTPENVALLSTETKTPLISSPGLGGNLLDNTPIKIDSETLYNEPFWDLNSKYLFFSKTFGEIYKYEVDTHIINKIIPQDLLNEAIFTVTPAIPSQLPAYFWASASPSGSKTIYFELANTPPTPIMEDGYPVKDELINAPLWLWENGHQTKLDHISICDPIVLDWTLDETQVIVVESQIPQITCIDADKQVWLVNLNNLTIKPFFSRQEYPNLRLYGLTPSGEALLYGLYSETNGANLAFLNLSSLESEKLPVPVIKFVDWLDEDRMLVVYHEGQNSFDSVGILDLENLKFTNLTANWSDKYITSYQLAPNKKWLAITTGSSPVSYDDLWLIKLSDIMLPTK